MSMVLLLTAGTVLISCDAKVGEEPPPQKSQELSGLQCLSSTAPVIEAYLKGEAQDIAVANAWDCAAGAIEKFQRYVRGSSADSYTPQELATFLEQNFLNLAPGKTVSVKLQKEFMKLKKLLIGGSDQHITRAELDKVIVVLHSLKAITLNLNPSMKVLTQHWQAQGQVATRMDFFEEANKGVQAAARALAALIEVHGESYQLSDIASFTQEMEIFFDKDWDFPQSVVRYMPIVKKVKKALAGGNENAVGPGEWSRFLVVGSRGYIQYLRYVYFVENQSPGNNQLLSYLAVTVDDVLSIFEDLVAEKEGQTITVEEINGLLNTLQTAWPKFQTSEILVAEIMKVKPLFFGGTEESFTPADFTKGRSKVGKIRSLSEDFMPYLEFYTMSWNPRSLDAETANKKFLEAQTALVKVAGEAAGLMESSFDLENLLTLAEEVDYLYPPEKLGYYAMVDQYLQIVVKVKETLLEQPGTVIHQDDWSKLGTYGGRVYGRFLHFYYFIMTAPAQIGAKSDDVVVAIDGVLAFFEDVTKVSADQMMSAPELKRIISFAQMFVPAFKSSDKLIAEIMNLKPLIFGGNTQGFTSADFALARTKVNQIRVLLETLQPHSSVYAQTWDAEQYSQDKAEKIFFEAQDVLTSAAKTAAAMLEGSYDLENLSPLAEELDRLYPAKGSLSVGEILKKYSPALMDVKKMMFGDKNGIVRKEDWDVLADLGSRGYGEYLYFHYFLKGKSLEYTSTLRSMTILVNQSLDLLRDLIISKQSGYFSKSELTRIIRHLVKLDLIPNLLSDESISKVLDVLLNNILVSPTRRLSGYDPTALNASSVEVARQEAMIWLETQTWISKKLNAVGKDEGFKKSALIDAIEDAQGSKSISTALKVGLGEMMLTLSGNVSMTVDSKGRLEISNKISHRFGEHSLFRLNLTRQISRLLLRAFVNSGQRLSKYQGATLSEVESAFKRVRSVVAELGLIDEDNTTFAASRFREANIFVPHADGNNLISFAEMNDLTQMIWSGLLLNNDLKRQLIKDCFDEKRVRNSAKVSLNCLRSSYRRSMPRLMVSMPEYIEYANGISDKEWVGYVDNIFKAAGYVPNASQMASLDEISLTPHAMQYLEMVYARYDANQDNHISTQESLKAFPAFEGILTELAAGQLADGSLKKENLLDLFTYILRYGHPPLSIGDKIFFMFQWVDKPEKWDVYAGRSHLAQILGYIADETSKAKAQNKPVKLDFNLEVSQRR